MATGKATNPPKNIRCGHVVLGTVPSNNYGYKTVELSPPMPNTNYSVSLVLTSTSVAWWTKTIAGIYNKTSSSFTIMTQNTAEGSTGSLEYDYIVVGE